VVAGSTAVPVHRNGQGRLIGWTSLQRMPTTPEIPTFAEHAAGLEALSWFGLLAPARTPDAMVRRLHAAAAEALKDQRIQERLTHDAQFIVGNTPEEFAQFLRDQDKLWRPILNKLDVQNN
jgi:tripartite-type tricarboxylate transporter receptor subunit TctC